MDYSNISIEDYEQLTASQRALVPLERKLELLRSSDEDGITLKVKTVGDLTDDELRKAMNPPRFGESADDYAARVRNEQKAMKEMKKRHIVPKSRK
jgi:hypothetical protein